MPREIASGGMPLGRSGTRWLAEHVGPFVVLMAMADPVEWGDECRQARLDVHSS